MSELESQSIDVELEENIKQAKAKTKKLYLYVVLVVIINFFVYNISTVRSGFHFNFELINAQEKLKSDMLTIFMRIPLIGLILSLILSFMPYNSLKYAQKYLYYTALVILNLQILILVSRLVHFVVTFFVSE